MTSQSLVQSKTNPLVSSSQDGKFFCLELLLLLLISVAAILIAGPAGNFPINDDRLYADGVKSILETGSFSIEASNAFDFIPIQVGVICCRLFGFSYEVLRWTTIVFHLFGIAGLFFALRALRATKFDSALIASIYALNPFMVGLSLSFMSDVPALAFCNWAIFAAIIGITRCNFLQCLLSICLITAATSIRQSSLILLPPILLCSVLCLSSIRSKVLILVAGLLIPGLTFYCLQYWLLEASLLTSCYDNYSSLITKSFPNLLSPYSVMDFLAKGLCYLGLFLMPIILTIFAKCLTSISKDKLKFLASLILAIFFVSYPLSQAQIHGSFMPYSLNLFMPPLVGAYCLIGGAPTWSNDHLKQFTLVAEVAAIITAFCMVYFFASIPRVDQHNRSMFLEQLFLTITILCMASGLVVQLGASNFDRYYSIALAPLLICLTPLWNRLKLGNFRIIAVVLSATLAIYTVMATLDFMNFSRSQWQAIDLVEKEGVPAKKIDGGPNYTRAAGGILFLNSFNQGGAWPDKMRGRAESRNLRWWPIIQDDYVISTFKIPSFHPIHELYYWSPISWKKRKMYILKADDAI